MTKTNKHPKKPGPRALARLMAVQALYLLHMNKDATTAGVLQDFHNMSQEEMEGVPLITQVDAEFLSDLVTGVSKSESAIYPANFLELAAKPMVAGISNAPGTSITS